ncbi:hypothetical protein D3C86_1420960 [compost metagenome]
MAAVEHQVAAYLLHAVGAQVAQQQPELFHVQLGVTAAFEKQIAVQHAVFQLAVGVELGFPLVRRAEQLQCGKGGHQLHGRGRVDRHVGIEEGAGARAGKRQGDHRQGLAADLAGFQRLLDPGRQAAVDGGMQGQGERQEQTGNGQVAQGLDHGRIPFRREVELARGMYG